MFLWTDTFQLSRVHHWLHGTIYFLSSLRIMQMSIVDVIFHGIQGTLKSQLAGSLTSCINSNDKMILTGLLIAL